MADEPTAESRPRWWELEGLSIAAEIQWFCEAGLEFTLDNDLFARAEVVRFDGELRLGEQRVCAWVAYPPAYGAGGHPEVMAPGLLLGRHKTKEGLLCLDHAVFGRTSPMYGAEAVERAERLWDLWVNDPAQLEIEEADVPDPHAEHYSYFTESNITLFDVDVGGADCGYFRLQADSLYPLRAVVTQVRVTHPRPALEDAGQASRELAGVMEINGPWRRVAEPPPHELSELSAWLESEEGPFLHAALRHGQQVACEQAFAALPVVFALVYEDDGPAGERHDAWLFVCCNLENGSMQLARASPVRKSDHWLRQPHLAPLGHKNVAVVGVGALGSGIADLLAKAGVGQMLLVDLDRVTHGNRIRHQLDLADAGREKTKALARRVRRVHPWCEVLTIEFPVGHGAGGMPEAVAMDDLICDQLGKVDLIVNATANWVAGSYLSSIAVAGAWGGRVLLQRPRLSGCWDCLALAQEDPEAYDGDVQVPAEHSDPNAQQVAERGCADPTFTGPGFELAHAAAVAARVVVQALLVGEGGYPPPDFDLTTMHFRDEASARPSAEYTTLPPHPSCTTCRAA